MLNPFASAFIPAFAYNNNACPIAKAVSRLHNCGAQAKDIKRIKPVLAEWFSSTSLNRTLQKWEEHNPEEQCMSKAQNTPMTFILYNVEALNSRDLEVTELAHQTETEFIICVTVKLKI